VICGWLAPMFAMRFIASPVSYILYLTEKQNYDLIWQVALLAMTFSSFYLPATYKLSLILYSLGYSILYGIYCLMSYNFCKGDKF
jgi:O-antigen/teichoic acid export membrane protein